MKLLLDIIRTSARELTGEHAKEFKGAMKRVIESAIDACRSTPGNQAEHP
jgi:acetylglutamate kinase